MDKSYFITNLIEKDLIRHSDFEDKARNLYDGFKLLYGGCQGHTSPEVFNQAFQAASPHNTTQQALIGSIFALLHSIAAMEGNDVSGRNEYAIELAQNLLGAYKEKYGLELPKQLPCI